CARAVSTLRPRPAVSSGDTHSGYRQGVHNVAIIGNALVEMGRIQGVRNFSHDNMFAVNHLLRHDNGDWRVEAAGRFIKHSLCLLGICYAYQRDRPVLIYPDYQVATLR